MILVLSESPVVRLFGGLGWMGFALGCEEAFKGYLGSVAETVGVFWYCRETPTYSLQNPSLSAPWSSQFTCIFPVSAYSLIYTCFSCCAVYSLFHLSVPTSACPCFP